MTRRVPAWRTALNVDEETEVTLRCGDSSMHKSLGRADASVSQLIGGSVRDSLT